MFIESILPITHIISNDNGVGSNGIALFGPDNLVKYEKLPIKSTLNYQKEEQHITRIDVPELRKLLKSWDLPVKTTKLYMERPMINATRFKASMSASRCLEATLILIEEFGFDYEIIDSKTWQRVLLPGIEGSNELKKASLELGRKLYPQFKFKKDADSLLIGHYIVNRKTLEPVKVVVKPKKKEL